MPSADAPKKPLDERAQTGVDADVVHTMGRPTAIDETEQAALNAEIEGTLREYQRLAQGQTLIEKSQAPSEVIRELSVDEMESLLQLTADRFRKNMHRHPGLDVEAYHKRILQNPLKAWSLFHMEIDGQPDVVGLRGGKFLVMDCSPEAPATRQGLVYDAKAADEYHRLHPHELRPHSMEEVSNFMLVEPLDEDDVKQVLQPLEQFERFDRESQIWLATKPEMREKGNAMLAYRDDEGPQITHARAHSLYAYRGFRAKLLF